jgi:phosphatidylglycerophosphatase A
MVAGAAWIAGRAEVLLGQKDARPIVVDEVVGFAVTMAALPLAWGTLALGFVLFRFFDIVKPPPVRWVERRITGGYGVVLDDVMAGICAHIVLRVLWYVLTRGA